MSSASEEAQSTVNLTFLDPLGRGIEGLKYQVSEGGNVFIRGVSNAAGEARSFKTTIGTALTVFVERFGSDEMKQIKTLIPSLENYSVKLFSGKIKETMTLEKATGNAGSYRRKTQTAKAGEPLNSIARANGTTETELARLNGLTSGAALHAGQVIKVPVVATAGAVEGTASGVDTTTCVSSSVDTACEKNYLKPVPTQNSSNRGSNGTPKTTVAMMCDRNACLRIGMAGPLIEEINIRLTGFGGSVKTDMPIDRFTKETEAAVKNFQRDYMGVPETGKVCGAFLFSLDDFMKRFPILIESMKCPCGECGGFGRGLKNSESVNIYNNKKNHIDGVEYPGMHRGLAWLFRASLFYTSDKDRSLGYSFLKISSGYRCWYNNKKNGRATFNHMGNALDLQFSRNNSTTRCIGSDLETLRNEIFMKRLGAKRQWATPYSAALETAGDGAKSWVHVDVRNFGNKFKLEHHYSKDQKNLDGDLIVNLAKRMGFISIQACGGIPQHS